MFLVGSNSFLIFWHRKPGGTNERKHQVEKYFCRVNELAGEVAVATAALGQTAKEMTKETPELKDHNGKVLGGALKVSV